MKYPAGDIIAGTPALLDKCLAMYSHARIMLMTILPNLRNGQRTQR